MWVHVRFWPFLSLQMDFGIVKVTSSCTRDIDVVALPAVRAGSAWVRVSCTTLQTTRQCAWEKEQADEDAKHWARLTRGEECSVSFLSFRSFRSSLGWLHLSSHLS